MSAVLKFPRTRNRRVGRCAGPVPEGMLIPFPTEPPEPHSGVAVTIDPCCDRTELRIRAYPADVAARVVPESNQSRWVLNDGTVLIFWRELAN